MNNNYELNRHKKSDAVKWIVVFTLIVLLLAGMIASLTLVLSDGKDNPAEENAQSECAYENDFATEMKDSPYIKLAMSSAAVAAADNSVSKTIIAKVYPENAQNKEVDWTIEWLDDTNTTDISEYVTVVPDSDGSLTATITCYKPFTGEALITATTREGRVFDTCRVVFVGNPSSLQVSCNGMTQVSGSIGSYYELGSGNTYIFDIAPSNVFGQVGADCNYTYEIKGHGTITVQTELYNTVVSQGQWTGDESMVNISDITKVSNYDPSVFDCAISGSTLSFTVNCTLEEYNAGSNRVGNVITYENKFKRYTDDSWYYEIIVTETNSGISQSFKVRPVVAVTNITVSEDIITF